MFVKLFTVTVLYQIIIYNNIVLSASIPNSTADNLSLSTTSTTPKSSIIQHSNSNFSLAPRTDEITHGTTIKPANLINKEPPQKLIPKKVVKREKKVAADEGTVTTPATPNDELANALKEKFQAAQNRIQEKIQTQNKKLQQEIDSSKPETAGDSEAKASEISGDNKKEKKEGLSSAKVSDAVAAAVAAAVPSPPPSSAPLDEPAKPINAGGAAETISFTKTVDLPIINKPNDKQNVFVVGDKGNATFSRTLNSLSVEAHNIL